MASSVDILLPVGGVISQRWAYEQAVALERYCGIESRLHAHTVNKRRPILEIENDAQLTASRLGRLRRLFPHRAGAFGSNAVLAHFADTALNWKPTIDRHPDTRLYVYCHGRDAIAPRARHGSDKSLWGVVLQRRVAWLRERAEHWFCASDYVRQVVRQQYDLAPAQVTTAYLGVDTAFWTPASDTRRREKTFVFVGRRDLQKGVDIVLRAWQLLGADRRSGWRLLLVGSPGDAPEPSGSEFRDGSVEVHGPATREELRDIYRRGAWLVVPSRPHYFGRGEGLGLVALESQACGMPVIAFDSGGLREAISPDASFLVGEPSADALARYLQDAIAVAPPSASRGQLARNFVENRFGLPQCIGSLASLMSLGSSE